MSLFGPPNVEKMKAKGDIKGLVKALTYEKDQTICQQAANALASIGMPAVEPLVAALQDKDQKLREAAVQVLDKLGWQAPNGQLEAYYWVTKQQWDKCVEIGSPAVLPLIEALERGHAAESVVTTLSRIGVPAIEPLINRLARSGPDPTLRAHLENSLVQIGTPAVAPLILALQNEKTRHAAVAEALGLIGDPRAVEPLGAILRDPKNDFYLCSDAARALGRIGTAPAIEYLIDTFKRYDVAFNAIVAVATIGSSALEPLILALEASEILVRVGAIIALNEMGAAAVEPVVAAFKKDGLAASKFAAALSTAGDQLAMGIGAIRNEKWYKDKYEEKQRNSGTRQPYGPYRYEHVRSLINLIDPRVIVLIAFFRGEPSTLDAAIQKALAKLD